MQSAMRRMLKARYVAPVALVGCVGVVGLLSFSPDAAQADVAGTATSIGAPATTLPDLTNPATTATPAQISEPAAPSVAGAVKYAAPSNQTGLFYVPLPKAFVAPGQALFAANCSTCHGSQALGTTRAPNLQGLGAGTVDFWVSTGRMPLAVSSVQATRKPPRFNRLQTLEIAAWVQSLTPGEGVQIPVVNTDKADLEAGGTLFTLNCAACHTIRSGPGNMPRFGAGDITNTEARDIASYVHGVIQHPSDPGGVGLGGIGPVGEGFVGLLLGVGILMLVCFWIGDRT